MSEKITYTDKVAIQNDESVAEINKVTDDDINEIKNVVNANADTLDELSEKNSTSATEIKENTENIESNTTDIAELKTKVETNTTNITKNTSNISANTAKIANKEGKHSYYRYDITEDIDSGTEIDLDFEYTLDADNLVVLFCGGDRLIKDSDYEETSFTSITLLFDVAYIEDYDKYIDFIVKKEDSDD